MTLLAKYSFDNLGNDGANVDSMLTGDGWLSSDTCLQETSAPRVRTGRAGVQVPNTAFAGLAWRTPGDQDTLIFGFSVWDTRSVTSVNQWVTFQYNDGAAHNTQVTLRTDTNNALEVTRGDGTVLATSANQVISLQNHHFIEVKLKVSQTVGFVIVRVDDAEVINATGLDTANVAAEIVNQIRFHPSATFVIDDFYLADTAGAVNNDFLGGETRNYSLLPDGAGDSSQWVPTGAAANYLAIDEAVPDEDATYNSSSVAGEKDLVTVADLPAGVTTIYGLRVVLRARRVEGGTGNVILIVKLGGVELESPTKTLDTTYKNVSHIFETKPGGGNWTPADVDAVQIGYKYV